MRILSFILLATTFPRCTETHRQPPIAPKTDTSSVSSNREASLTKAPEVEKKEIRYSDRQLEHFLDSIGRLPTKPLMNEVQFHDDSVFRSGQQLNHELSKDDFETLKTACREGQIDKKTALRILPDFLPDDSSYRNDTTVNLIYFPF